ncbi:hypothetical protein V6N12_003250 [Hibiscus sabdariffa]|uniref:Uncharacterized protein n=1 Tax=Hibiscus sabdariffa TaxID=183260 RepID=A0ABR2EBF4_9ROSI
MIMQRFPVKNNVLDSEPTTKFGFGGNEQPVCPKPRRLVGPAAVPEFLKPLRCTKHRQATEENQVAVAAGHPVHHLRGEQAIPWFTTCTSFIRWSVSHPSADPSFRINSASPLPPPFEH